MSPASTQGLGALGARPFEYLLTGAAPRPWRAEDSLLAVWAMFIDLQGNQEPRELARGWLRAHSDDAQLAFLLPQASSWDAPLDGVRRIQGRAGPGLRARMVGRRSRARRRSLAMLERGDMVGSNNYAHRRQPQHARARRSSPTTCTWACSCRTSGTGWP